MAEQRLRYHRARRIFLTLFILSTLLTLGLGSLSLFMRPMMAPLVTPTAQAVATYQTTPQPVTQIAPVESLPPGPNETQLAVYGSLLTSVVTFIGFVSTTILGWRKQISDDKDRELERKFREIELEKERLALEKMKREKQKRSHRKTE